MLDQVALTFQNKQAHSIQSCYMNVNCEYDKLSDVAETGCNGGPIVKVVLECESSDSEQVNEEKGKNTQQ